MQKPEGRILAVVGAGHRQGISAYLDNPATLPPFEPLTQEPKSFPWGKVFGFGVTAIFILLLLAIAFSGVGIEVLVEAFLFWVLIHGRSIPLLGAYSRGAFSCLRAPRGWAPVNGIHLFLCCMVYLLKSHDPCRLDWCICRGKSEKTAHVGLP